MRWIIGTGGVVLLALNSLIPSVVGSPTPEKLENSLRKRDTPPLCDDNQPDNALGYLWCLNMDDDSGEGRITCDECLGRNGNSPAVTGEEPSCYIGTGDPNTLGNFTSCPGDPAPAKMPDGSDNTIAADGIVTALCDGVGPGNPFGWATWAACFMYSFEQAGNTLAENEAGIDCEYLESVLSWRAPPAYLAQWCATLSLQVSACSSKLEVVMQGLDAYIGHSLVEYGGTLKQAGICELFHSGCERQEGTRVDDDEEYVMRTAFEPLRATFVSFLNRNDDLCDSCSYSSLTACRPLAIMSWHRFGCGPMMRRVRGSPARAVHREKSQGPTLCCFKPRNAMCVW